MLIGVDPWKHSRAFKRGAAVGALVLTWFGAAWAFVALANRPSTPVWQFVLFTIPVIALVTAAILKLRTISKSLQPPKASRDDIAQSARQGRRIGFWFALVLGIEMIAIAAGAFALASMGQPLLIPVAVIAIVGAHFLPLARIFRIPVYGYAGVILLGLAVGSFLIADEATRVFALGIAVSLVLWTCAGVVLAIHT